MRVLVLNPGSATLKATVLDLPDRASRFDRTIDWTADLDDEGRRRAVDAALARMTASGIDAASLEVVGYRVVHGGPRFRAAVLIDDDVVTAIEALGDLAPLHNPVAAATIRPARSALPGIPHVAAFDTGFHATLSGSATRYPVPDRWTQEFGVRRYGFHGLSVEWSMRRAAELLGRPADRLGLIVAHLGGGCSVTAVDRGRSVATSMGMTPLEGLMMGTRAGSIDPGVIVRLARSGMAIDALADDLEHGSGLLGVGGTADVRALLAAEAAGDDRASLALAMFVERAAAGIAAAATSLPRLDSLVFTGGIGEHAGTVRARIVGRLAVLGVPSLAADASDAVGVPGSDAAADAILVGGDGQPAILRIAAREDLVIASSAAALLPASR